MRRIREVLETHEWAASSSSSNSKEGHDDDDSFGLNSDGEEGEDGFALEVNELEREMMGLRMAIEKGGGDGFDDLDDFDDDDDDDDKEMKVEGLESLMMRMQAIKGMHLFYRSIIPTGFLFQCANINCDFRYERRVTRTRTESVRSKGRTRYNEGIMMTVSAATAFFSC